jgi:Rod binding domain-containing protein
MNALTLNTDARAASQGADRTLFGQRGSSAGQSDFASVLGKVKQRGDETVEDYARRTAENFVAIGLVQPLLKKFRESNQAAAPFSPTQAEKQFQGLADAELAQRMVHARGFAVVDKITEQLVARAKGAAKPATTEGVEVAA